MTTKLDDSPTAQLIDETIAELQAARTFWVQGASIKCTNDKLKRVRFLLGSVQNRIDAHMGD